jgi:serine protease AprX
VPKRDKHSAHLIDLRIQDANGMSGDSVVIRAIASKNQYDIRVINLSIGRPIFESYTLDPLCAAVTAAWKKALWWRQPWAKGRNGYATITSPGNDPYAITVGAMKTEGLRSAATTPSPATAPKAPPGSISK